MNAPARSTRTERAFQDTSRSRDIGVEAPHYLAGGDSRTGLWQPPWPVYVGRASGNRLWDLDGDVRLDMNPNNTSHIHGHAHPDVVRAITGSFNGNPLATGASLVVLEKLTEAAIARINALGDALRTELLGLIDAGGYHATVTGFGSLLCFFPTTGRVDPADLIDYRSVAAARCGEGALGELRTAMLREGIANGAGQMSLTTVLTDDDIAEYLAAVERVMPSVLTRS